MSKLDEENVEDFPCWNCHKSLGVTERPDRHKNGCYVEFCCNVCGSVKRGRQITEDQYKLIQRKQMRAHILEEHNIDVGELGEIHFDMFEKRTLYPQIEEEQEERKESEPIDIPE